MKERELREHANCSYCQNLIGEAQVPGFFTVEVVGYRLDGRAMQRQDGLAAMISPALAMHMGTGADLAVEFEREKHTMCWTCWVEKMPQPGGGRVMNVSELPYEERLVVELLHYCIFLSPKTENMRVGDLKAIVGQFFDDAVINRAISYLQGGERE